MPRPKKKTEPLEAPPPPKHRCQGCGALLDPTPTSWRKWMRTETDFQRVQLAQFYECPCSEYALQVLTKEEADAYFQEVYRSWGRAGASRKT